jgi:hypothetical protein
MYTFYGARADAGLFLSVPLPKLHLHLQLHIFLMEATI